MTRNRLLVLISVLSMILLTVHITDDTVRGISPAGPESMYAITIAALLLCAVLVHPERALGMICMFLVNLFAYAMPILHLRGTRINEIAASAGGFRFIWTLWALGILGFLGMILAVTEFVQLRRAKPQG